jgi:hypothetical protein
MWGFHAIFFLGDVAMTLEQTVTIPADRRLHLDFDIPFEIPEGKARIEMKVIPFVKKEEIPEPPLKCLVGVETPRSDRLLGAASNLGNVTIDELRDEWLTEKYLK